MEREAETIEGRIADIIEDEALKESRAVRIGKYRVSPQDTALIVRALRTISTTNGTVRYER